MVIVSTFYNHWQGIGGKTNVQLGIEIVDRLEKANASHLKKIVDLLLFGGKTTDHAEHQPQVSDNERLSCFGASFLAHAAQKRLLFCLGERF